MERIGSGSTGLQRYERSHVRQIGSPAMTLVIIGETYRVAGVKGQT
jgi:hypothetical protein